MEDFRFIEDNFMWIIIILAFFLLTNGGCKGFNFGGLDCLFNGLFDGCNNTWLWIVIAVVAYWYFTKGCGGSIFRNEIQ